MAVALHPGAFAMSKLYNCEAVQSPYSGRNLYYKRREVCDLLGVIAIFAYFRRFS